MRPSYWPGGVAPKGTVENQTVSSGPQTGERGYASSVIGFGPRVPMRTMVLLVKVGVDRREPHAVGVAPGTSRDIWRGESCAWNLEERDLVPAEG